MDTRDRGLSPLVTNTFFLFIIYKLLRKNIFVAAGGSTESRVM